MIKRCLLVLFVHLTVLQRCRAIQYAPVDVADQTECALVLDSSTRSNLYDYGLNLLRGSFGFGNGQTCITYDAVNQAYIQARKRIHVAQPQGDWKAEDVATVGELLLDISAQLAKTYGLSVDDIEKGLPLIDTSKTLIQEVCPPYLSNVECHPGKYRRHDGLCNNLNNPTWGAINTPFTRLVPPQFADGMNAPRSGVLGNPLPIPRIVSRTMHPDEGYHDHAGTVMVVAWGQFMDHDFTLTATPLDARNKNDPEECCNRPPHQKHPYCLEIIIPDDDYFYHKYNVKCHDFVRSFPSARPGCRLGSKTPYNTLTGVIDGNTVYGVTEEFSRHLRSGYLGQLRMNPVFSEYGLKDLLPLKLDIPDEGCTRSNSSQYCFEAGEIRVNEQLVLTCMHTLMAREHNRLAGELAKINPHWDDETLYQEARRIVIAEIQHITYNEFLPIILGKEVMEKFGIILQKEGYWDGYDTQINPNIIDAFSAAAFRFGHSLLPTAVERWSKAHKFISSKRLSDLIRRPYDLYRAGVMDEYLMGLMNQVAQAMDDSITQEVTNHLLKKPGMRFGLDLVAFNMQRGREFGVPGYMEFRKFCGLPTATSFEEMFGSMPNSTVYRYMSIFEHPNDVDLWSGGVSERPLPGSMIGPTFACIIATQLSYARRGDRFWYELPNQPSTFSPEQLQEIRKIKLSRIMCDNTDLLDTIQIYPMVLPDHEINPRVPCRSGIIPSIDLTKWAAYPDSAAPHAQFKSLNISNLATGQPAKDNNTSNNTHFLLFPPVQKNVVNSEINLQTLDGELTPKKVLAYLAVPSVFYIQLLRARLGRVKRDNSDDHWEKIRTLSTESKSSLDNSKIQRSQSEHIQHNINNSSKAINQTNVKYETKPELKNRTSNLDYKINTGHVNTSKVPKTENEDQELQQDSSHRKSFEQKRLYHNQPFQSKSSESVDEYKYDYIPTTTYDEGEKRGADYSLFDNPVYNDYDDFYDTEEKEKDEEGEEEEEKKLEIIDVHDEHDLDYEYVPLNVNTSREPTGEMNENEHTNNSPEYIVNDKENSNFKSNSENDNSVKYHNPFYDSLFKSDFVEQLFPQSVTKTNDGYIKEPLAGPNATRGFGHDFKVQRGNKVKGNVGTQLPNRFPTVGYFNTKQVHKLLQQPQLVTNNTNGGTRLKNFTKTVVLQPVPSFDGSSDDHYGPRFESVEEFSGYEDQPESIEDSPEYVDFDYDESVTKQKLRTRNNVRDFSNYPSGTQDEISGSNDELQRGEFSIKKPLLIQSKTNNENKRNIQKFSENSSRNPTNKEHVDIHKQQNKYKINRSNPKHVSNIDSERPNLYIVYPTNGKILNTEIQSKDTINNPSIPKRIYKSTERDEYEDGSDEEYVTHKILKNDNESENSEKKPVEEEEHKEAARDEDDNVEEEEDTGIYRTISKILEGKDQISREKNILKGPKPQVYNNYWTLEYSFPKKK